MNLQNPDFRRVVLAGFAATLTLTVLMYVSPLVGFPGIDMASAIGGFLDRPAEMFTARWWAGFCVFALVGIVVSPLLFSRVAPFLFGNAWQRGLVWGLLLWMFGGVCVMIHFGLAFHPPFTTQPHISSFVSFLGNLVYGVVLGLAMPGVVGEPAAIREKHA